VQRGAKVFVLKGSGPWNDIPCARFYGAVNLDTAAQTANVSIFGATNTYDAGSIIASANKLGVGGSSATLLLPYGVAVNERKISVATDAPISGLGIALYYDVEVR
jgi:hypothetical protein